MNIGTLDKLLGIYKVEDTKDDFGSVTLSASPTFLGMVYAREIPKKSFMTTEAQSSMINKNTFEFIARYDDIVKAGRYFLIGGETAIKYYIRGVEEIGRKKGMKIYAESKISRE
tara:strand:+ start:3506 stop:3847 length:342 start_codon:yes stop_codon:yes gene_type:complete